MPPGRVLYLHGFASSARSTKAGYFGRKFEPLGVPFRCPDFNEPDWSALTMTRMLDQLEAELTIAGDGPVASQIRAGTRKSKSWL